MYCSFLPVIIHCCILYNNYSMGGTMSNIIRSQRLQYILRKPLVNPNVNYSQEQDSFLTSMMHSINISRRGVKILWDPNPSGKSTTVRQLLIKMKQNNMIQGASIIHPPNNRYLNPSKWLRNALFDNYGPLLYKEEKLSHLLPSSNNPPYVFVLDHIDDSNINNEMKCFISTLAEDSSLTKSYIVIIITPNIATAKKLCEWNDDKIVMLN